MAEGDEKGGSAMGNLLIFIVFLVVLIGAWYASGGPERADLRGIFLAPPAPLGTGDAYGPGGATSTQNQQYDPGYYYQGQPQP